MSKKKNGGQMTTIQFENEEQRKTVMYSTALQNEAAAGKGSSTTSTLLTLIGNLFKT